MITPGGTKSYSRGRVSTHATTVASPCQTLRKLLAGDHEFAVPPSISTSKRLIGPVHQLAVLLVRSSPRVCTN